MVNGCRFTNCFATKDRSTLPLAEFDAVIIHIRGLPNDWPKARSPHQRFIMLSIDAPVRLYEYRRLERLAFNWTMTYRQDSTFPIPYATIQRVLPLPAPPGSPQLDRYIANFGHSAKNGPNSANLARGKVGLIAQISSKCHTYSRSETYVRELRRFIPVDIYGKCGEFPCPAAAATEATSDDEDPESSSDWSCQRTVATKYKFFLAFEDAFCKDYVTEKFFSIFNGGVDMIPIVMGTPRVNYSQIAPQHSFIDASQFRKDENDSMSKINETNISIFDIFFALTEEVGD